MTKKHFNAIAKIMRENKKPSQYVWESIVLDLSIYFESENPNFNRAHFLKACKGEK